MHTKSKKRREEEKSQMKIEVAQEVFFLHFWGLEMSPLGIKDADPWLRKTKLISLFKICCAKF